MTSSTPSAPINDTRGAADTTAGRIYFSTPSAQVRVPVGDLVFPPYLCSHYTTWGKIYPAAEKLSRVGACEPKIRKKSENCRTVPKIPYSLS